MTILLSTAVICVFTIIKCLAKLKKVLPKLFEAIKKERRKRAIKRDNSERIAEKISKVISREI